ncbi:MAG: Ribosomal RNA small subunit methyltransferase A [Lentisphaerae bacterium ADurb.Bin242]|nr:MAG: Ribosomal RNA small subunit methyltransferase A [Lentisphaerae bacterium ADurb.Bin242]
MTMNKKELTALMKQLGVVPSKRMGQNFLVDSHFIESIVRAARISGKDHVLEVGPGFGALTESLLRTGAAVAAIEFDRKIAAWLRERFKDTPLRLIEDDACKTDIPAIFGPDTPFRLVSNLPYSAGTVIVANMLTLKTPPSDMLVMLQKEVGMRLSSAAGESEYGSLSVRVQVLYEVENVRTAPPDLFFPKPEVDSSILRLTLREDRPGPELFRTLSTLVKVAFAHRRKKMFKQIASVFGEEAVTCAMNSLGISLDIRAEKISPSLFLQLAGLLKNA